MNTPLKCGSNVEGVSGNRLQWRGRVSAIGTNGLKVLWLADDLGRNINRMETVDPATIRAIGGDDAKAK